MTDPARTDPNRPPLSRRDLLRLGLVGTASLAAGCAWDGGPLKPGFRAATRFNDWLGEALVSPHRLAPEFPLSERTPERHFPAYARTRPISRLQVPEGWTLEVGGLVRQPMRLTREMLEALPRLTYTVKHHCVEGWSAVGTWTGVPLSAVAALVEPTPAARYLRFDSFDRGYSNGWDLTTAYHPQTILAYGWNDRPMEIAHGAPLRLYSPLKLGYKLTKFLTAMTFTAERHGGYWEDRGYPWFGGI